MARCWITIAWMGAALAVLLLPVQAQSWGRNEAEALLTAGRAALEDGFHDLAERKFRAYIDAARLRDHKARGSVWLAQALLGQGRAAEAQTWMEGHRDWAAESEVASLYVFWTARVQLDAGQPAAAADTLAGFQKSFPQDPLRARAYRLWLQARWRAGERDDVLAGYVRAGKLFPDEPELPLLFLDWADALAAAGRPAEAVAVLERLVKEFPDGEVAPQARLALGRLLAAQSRPDDAGAAFDGLARAVELPAGVRATAWYEIARLAEARGDAAASLAAYTEAEILARAPDLARASRMGRARELARAGRADEAVALLEEAVKAAPLLEEGAGELQLALARLLLDQGRYADALAAYERHLEAYQEPAGQAQSLAGRAWCLWRLQRYAEAAAAFEKASLSAAGAAGRARLLQKAADSYFQNAQYKLAGETWRRAMGEDAALADDPAVWRMLAEAQALQGETSAALAALRDLRARFAGREEAVQAGLRMAALEEDRGSWDEAVRLYNGLLQETASTNLQAEILFRSASAFYRGGRFDDAFKRAGKVLAEHAGTPWAERSFFLRAQALHLQGDSRRAIEMAREFETRFPASPWLPQVRFWLGEQAFNAGDYAGAEQLFRDNAARFPSDGGADAALFWAGRAASAQGEYRRAIESYAALLRVHTNSALRAEARFAQGDALSELGEFSGAILAFDEVIRHHSGLVLTDRARGRRGDCQFTLGPDNPERYKEALASYRAVMDSPTAPPAMKLQAEYKAARCHEKMAHAGEAFEYYMNVVYGWLALRERGVYAEPLWFTRAAFAAAALKEAAGQPDEAVRIYERIRGSGLPAGAEAEKRIEKLRSAPAPSAASVKGNRA